MRRFLYSLLFLILFIASGYLLYTRWIARQPAEIWSLIPDNAVLVIESTDVLELRQNWQAKLPFQALEELPYFRKIIFRLDTLLQMGGYTPDFFTGKTIHSSVHVTANDNIDYLFFVPIRSGPDQQFIDEVLNDFKRNRKYRISARQFQDFTITEVYIPQTSTIFSYIIHKQTFIGSYTPFLVEDAIRTIQASSHTDENQWTKIQPSVTTSTPKLEVYIQTATLPHFLGAFATSFRSSAATWLSNFAQSGTLQLSIADSDIALTGISQTTAKDNVNNYLDIFRDQAAQPLACSKLIPNTTAILYHWGFSDAKKFSFALKNYLETHEPENTNAQETLRIRYGWRSNYIFDWLKNEIGLAVLESNQTEPGKLLFMQVTHTADAIADLNNFGSVVDKTNQNTPYIETYDDIPIRQISISEFPAQILGDAFAGFSQCYYAPVNNYVIFANRLQYLKSLLDNIRAENVWANSSRQKEWLKQVNTQANIGVFVNTNRGWNQLYQNTSAKWQSILGMHTETLQRFDRVAIQLWHEQENRFHTSMFIHYDSSHAQPKGNGKFVVNNKTLLDFASHTPPYVVRNHLDKSREVLIQDIQYQLYLLNSQGQIVWKKALGKPVVSEIHQIDYYKNNKLQYLFATPTHIMLLDRNGNTVENFPIPAPPGVRWHSVTAIDYENNRNYRLLAADLNGNLYLYTKEGQVLEGWGPLKMGYRLIGPAKYIRINGKDYIIAAQANGIIHAVNRRGEPYNGFPLNIQSWMSNPLFIESGLDITHTIVTVITDGGEIVRFNLAGSLVERKQLYRPSRNTQFILCPEAQQRDWLIARYDFQTISLLNKSGKVLFEKAWGFSNEPKIQYYDFGANFRVVAITNPANHETYLYDYAGKPISKTAIPNRQLLSILFIENYDKLLIYRSDDREIGMVSLKIK